MNALGTPILGCQIGAICAERCGAVEGRSREKGDFPGVRNVRPLIAVCGAHLCVGFGSAALYLSCSVVLLPN